MVILSKDDFQVNKKLKNNIINVVSSVVESGNNYTDPERYLNPYFFDIFVTLEIPKRNFENIPFNEKHYDQIVVVFENDYNGYLLFYGKEEKKLAEMYTLLAIEKASIENKLKSVGINFVKGKNPDSLSIIKPNFIYMAKKEEDSILVIKAKNNHRFVGEIILQNIYPKNINLQDALIEFVKEFCPELRMKKILSKKK